MQHKSFRLFEQTPESVIEKTEPVTIDIFESFCLFEQVPGSVIGDRPTGTLTPILSSDQKSSTSLHIPPFPAVGGEEAMQHSTEGVAFDIFDVLSLLKQSPEIVQPNLEFCATNPHDNMIKSG